MFDFSLYFTPLINKLLIYLIEVSQLNCKTRLKQAFHLSYITATERVLLLQTVILSIDFSSHLDLNHFKASYKEYLSLYLSKIISESSKLKYLKCLWNEIFTYFFILNYWSLILWFLIFEFGLRTSAYEFFSSFKVGQFEWKCVTFRTRSKYAN